MNVKKKCNEYCVTSKVVFTLSQFFFLSKTVHANLVKVLFDKVALFTLSKLFEKLHRIYITVKIFDVIPNKFIKFYR